MDGEGVPVADAGAACRAPTGEEFEDWAAAARCFPCGSERNGYTGTRRFSAGRLCRADHWASIHKVRSMATASNDVAKSFHMTPDEFRRRGKEMVDWIADYYERVETYPVLSQAKPGEVRAALPASAPAQGESFETMMNDVERVIMPGITHWQSPNFFAYFPSNNSFPSILGEMLSAGLGVQGMLWATSPACTELETHVLDWLVEMLALPAAFASSGAGGGVIQDTASSSALCALLAARERATNYDANERGCDGRLVAYTSSQAHSSIEKAVKIAGLGSANLRAIDVDENFAMRPEALQAQIVQDRSAGKIPCFVSATVGTTSSNAIDPVRRIGEICRDERLWLHVDAAMAGTAALCPEFRWTHDGVELADSYCFNPHKWMFTNFDCDCLYVADRKALIQTLSVLPEYLRNKATETGAVIDYRDWHIPLGRRFRALKLWFVIRHYGVEGLRHHVRRHVELARAFAEWVSADERFELAAPAPLNLVCFRHRGGDAINQAILDRLNASGELHLTHTRLNDRLTLRMSIGQSQTERWHIERAWKRIREAAAVQ
jgi:aromatic-L-amino-acid/L-tryptophan decarboxylase